MPPSPLVPALDNNRVSFDAILKSPATLNANIAQLTANRLIMPALFGTSTNKVEGGGLVYSVLVHGSNFSMRDVEQRSPGAEYIVNDGEFDFDLAKPQDWGSKIQVLDEEVQRNDTITLKNKLIQQANTIVRKIDQVAIAALDAALSKHSIAPVPGHKWHELVTAGPNDQLTPNANRPTADFARANLISQAQDLGGGTLNVLLLHPEMHMALKIGYGEGLAAALESAGITEVKSSMLIPVDTAYLVEQGKAGVVAFERPLTTETIDDRHHRATWIQSYAVPAFAVTNPSAAVKITGINATS
ncbi:hypothetical protein DW322_03395 [Rhodococcus rhodnii]|uniref:Major capsid protein n=2 Tax=Rhodococcus rhodnii TaxID=38312 RepID=R7WHQ9_9NOCA|nr:major capsid protein [Rhodococcus rhodnii]EOM74612.1 hypothetical protein Rrhod_4087 [Rhodococcus rhodnii LMG 5362]TXG89448.1 hypothetical protein DW322_03395 [Rhodococcus rhodnii]